MILKGGQIAWALMGDANASIPTPQPVHGRPMFGAFGKAVQSSSLTFVSQAAMKLGVAKKYGLDKQVAAVKNIRKVRKSHMVMNAYMPHMEIDVETYQVRADGQLLVCEPAKVLPMAQRYFLFWDVLTRLPFYSLPPPGDGAQKLSTRCGRATHLVPRQIPAVESVELTFDQRERFPSASHAREREAIGIQLKVGTMLSHGDKLAPCRTVAWSRCSLPTKACTKSALRMAPNFARIAYHVGNRHVPLQVEHDHLLMLPDHVLLRAMVEGLGGSVTEVRCGFQPESGAYGHSHVHHSHDDEGHGGRIHDGLAPRTQDR